MLSLLSSSICGKSVHKSPRSLQSTRHPPTISASHSHPKIDRHTPVKMQMWSKRHQYHKEARSPSSPWFYLFILWITKSTHSLPFTSLSKDMVAVDCRLPLTFLFLLISSSPFPFVLWFCEFDLNNCVSPTPVELCSLQVGSVVRVFHISESIAFDQQHQSTGFHKTDREVGLILRSHDWVLWISLRSIETTDRIGVSRLCRFHPRIQNGLRWYSTPSSLVHDGFPFWLLDN